MAVATISARQIRWRSLKSSSPMHRILTGRAGGGKRTVVVNGGEDVPAPVTPQRGRPRKAK
jgi:hypothetical protein